MINSKIEVKRFFSILLLSLVALTASAEFRFGPMLGVNGSSFFWKQNLVSSHYRIGGSAGIFGEIMIPGIGFGIDLALRYQMNGADVDFNKKVWNFVGTKTVLVHTLEIPLNLRFKYTRLDGLERIIAPFAYIGPVFTFNLATSSVTDGKEDILKIPAATFSLQAGAGVELIERLQISGGYYWGLSHQIRTVKLDDFTARPQGWFINAAWLF